MAFEEGFMDFCKFCGGALASMGVMHYPVEGRPKHTQYRYDFYCTNPHCGAEYTYSLFDDNSLMDMHWYDPGTHKYAEYGEEPEVTANGL
jgi:hypothetical protein